MTVCSLNSITPRVWPPFTRRSTWTGHDNWQTRPSWARRG